MSHTQGQRHFLLVGNGPYLNRGCEAIVRGTMRIIEHHFGSDFRVTLGTLGDAANVRKQARHEKDKRITHVPISRNLRRYSVAWWRQRCRRGLASLTGAQLVRQPFIPQGIDQALAEADVVLEVGGDNYSIHYGKYPPYAVVDLDRYILARRDVPIVLWGASVGPFEAMPDVAEEMMAHLGKLHAITARETLTYDYLRSKGLEANVHLVADPAFLMEPTSPNDNVLRTLPEDAIGFNVSPMLGRVKLGQESKQWAEICTRTVAEIIRRTRRHVLLIPHVTEPESGDYPLLQRILSGLAKDKIKGSDVTLLADNLNASETKYVISKMSLFAGARTHATIAAFSTGVPTVSFAYSVKAKGLTRDMLGDERYCIAPEVFSPEIVAETVHTAICDHSRLQAKLLEAMPRVASMAMSGGRILQQLID